MRPSARYLFGALLIIVSGTVVIIVATHLISGGREGKAANKKVSASENKKNGGKSFNEKDFLTDTKQTAEYQQWLKSEDEKRQAAAKAAAEQARKQEHDIEVRTYKGVPFTSFFNNTLSFRGDASHIVSSAKKVGVTCGDELNPMACELFVRDLGRYFEKRQVVLSRCYVGKDPETYQTIIPCHPVNFHDLDITFAADTDTNVSAGTESLQVEGVLQTVEGKNPIWKETWSISKMRQSGMDESTAESFALDQISTSIMKYWAMSRSGN